MIRTAVAAILVVLATALAVTGVLAGWVKTELLDEETWVTTSQELYADEDIRVAVAEWAVDVLYSRVNVEAQLEELLPGRSSILAGPLAAQLRDESESAIQRAVDDARTEELWVSVNRSAHRRFVRVIDGEDPIILSNGPIALDLRPLLEGLASRTRLGPEAVDRLPKNQIIVTPPRSERLERGIEGLRILDKWGVWIGLASVPMMALAMLVMPAARYRVWIWFGLLLALGGVALGEARETLGPTVAELLTETTTWNKAVLSTWGYLTDGLLDLSTTVVWLGLAIAGFAIIGGNNMLGRAAQRAALPLAQASATTTTLGVMIMAFLAVRAIDGLADRSFPTQLVLVGLSGAWWLQVRHAALQGDLAAAPPAPDQPT